MGYNYKEYEKLNSSLLNAEDWKWYIGHYKLEWLFAQFRPAGRVMSWQWLLSDPLKLLLRFVQWQAQPFNSGFLIILNIIFSQLQKTIDFDETIGEMVFPMYWHYWPANFANILQSIVYGPGGVANSDETFEFLWNVN